MEAAFVWGGLYGGRFRFISGVALVGCEMVMRWSGIFCYLRDRYMIEITAITITLSKDK